MLDGYVAACANDVGDVEEVVPAEPGKGDLCLFAFMAIVKGDDSARGVGAGSDFRGMMRGNGDVAVVVEAVDLEGLGVARLVVDVDGRHIGRFQSYLFGFPKGLMYMKAKNQEERDVLTSKQGITSRNSEEKYLFAFIAKGLRAEKGTWSCRPYTCDAYFTDVTLEKAQRVAPSTINILQPRS